MQSYLPAGLLLIPAVDSQLSEQPTWNGRAIPAVCIDRKPKGWTGDIVRAGNEAGAYSATLHLIDHGHRRVATIAGPTHLINAQERLKGFRRAVKQAGIELPSEYVQHGQFDRISGFEAALTLLRPASRPTAIFAANDLMAMGAIMAVRELGLGCPEDVSVVGFDNLDLVDLLQPPLTTVQQPVYRLGVTATQLLIQRITGLKDAPREILLETELIRRSSVMRMKQSAEERRGKSPSTRNLDDKGRKTAGSKRRAEIS